MTSLSKRKTRLAFTTDATVRYRGQSRNLVIEIPEGNGFTATIRLQGTRTRYPFSWLMVFDAAAQAYARNQREDRKQKRLARKKGLL
jgi:hypothetical protein